MPTPEQTNGTSGASTGRNRRRKRTKYRALDKGKLDGVLAEARAFKPAEKATRFATREAERRVIEVLLQRHATTQEIIDFLKERGSDVSHTLVSSVRKSLTPAGGDGGGAGGGGGGTPAADPKGGAGRPAAGRHINNDEVM